MFLSVMVRHGDVGAVGIGFLLFGVLWWGVSGGDTDAGLAQTFLVSRLVGLLPVGTAWSALLLIRVVVVGLGAAR
ncbi:hypothetical protein AB0O86_36940 [Streptomyces hirsutus]|uniref:hypothetical protein n=1 Tax=Streptomyces hirsutus TaxID=35620 RepID=UPI00341733F0